MDELQKKRSQPMNLARNIFALLCVIAIGVAIYKSNKADNYWSMYHATYSELAEQKDQMAELSARNSEELDRTKSNMNDLLSRIASQNKSLAHMKNESIALEQELALKYGFIEELEQKLKSQIVAKETLTEDKIELAIKENTSAEEEETPQEVVNYNSRNVQKLSLAQETKIKSFLTQGYTQLSHNNQDNAIKWFEKAMKIGSGEAALAIAKIYDPRLKNLKNDSPPEKDIQKAEQYYKRAADMGIPVR